MKKVENKLVDGFKSVELEERLEMVHLTALTETADMSIASDIEKADAAVAADAPVSAE